VVAQPDEKDANRTASVLGWYDPDTEHEHCTISGSKKKCKRKNEVYNNFALILTIKKSFN